MAIRGSAPHAVRTFDATIILAFVASYAGLPGVDPSVQNDPGYWVGRIQQTGGLGDDNKPYWVDKFYGKNPDTGTPDPFALEQGPLDYVDDQMTIFPGGDPTFESIVADQLGALDGADSVLASGRDTIAALDVGGAIDASGDANLGPATDAHTNIRAALDADNLGDEITAADGHRGEIDSGRHDYVQDPVPEQPVPDPGPQPPKDNNGGGPPPP